MWSPRHQCRDLQKSCRTDPTGSLFSQKEPRLVGIKPVCAALCPLPVSCQMPKYSFNAVCVWQDNITCVNIWLADFCDWVSENEQKEAGMGLTVLCCWQNGAQSNSCYDSHTLLKSTIFVIFWCGVFWRETGGSGDRGYDGTKLERLKKFFVRIETLFGV